MGRTQEKMIPASGTSFRISVSFIIPEDVPTKPPVIIMGHGIGGVKAAGLSPFAEQFARAGYAAVMFDYLHFGESEGLPVNLMSISRELEDFRDVIAWARQQHSLWDTQKVVVWGSSFGGMHVTSLMAQDHGLAGGIMQCPCVDGFGAAIKSPAWCLFPMLALALADWVLSLFSTEPIYLPLVADGSSRFPIAVMPGSEALEGWNRLLTDVVTPPMNKISARTLLVIPFSRPFVHIHRSIKPVLAVLPTWDNQTSLAKAEEAVRLAPLGEAIRVPGGHFDLYEGGIGFDENVRGQIEFLEKLFV